MRKRKELTILIIPEGSTGSIRKRFSYSMLYTLLTMVLILVAAFVFMIVNYSRVYYVALQAEILRRRNVKLEEQWKKIARIEKDLALIKRTDERIRKMLGTDLSPQTSALPSSQGVGTLGQADAAPAETAEVEPSLPISLSQASALEKMPTIWPARGWLSRLCTQDHTAVDIAAATGTPVVTTTSGKVVRAGWDDRYGKIIEIENDQGFRIMYGHNSRLLVREGEVVSKGDVIAFVGSTGLSSAPHLHYEIRLKGKPVDPLRYLVH